MKLIANILWFVFGGLETALCYFAGSLGLALTIIGIPWALQTFKLGLLCLWPFGAKVEETGSTGCLMFPLWVVWALCGGFVAFLLHLGLGLLFCITIIGIPWAHQHLRLASLALMPFGKKVTLSL